MLSVPEAQNEKINFSDFCLIKYEHHLHCGSKWEEDLSNQKLIAGFIKKILFICTFSGRNLANRSIIMSQISRDILH